MTMDTDALPKGTLIDGRYDIREQLGQGGMGTVYRALDKKLGQMVALKMLLHTGGSERSRDERRRRFMREIYAINEVQHRNVVHIQEFGFYNDTPYMVMELLSGQDLNKILRANTDLLPIEYSVDLMLPVCAAIQACHDAGVIHRDLKPGNIMVTESDFAAGWDVKVVDFSISKVAADLTQDGQILGTPNYLSPEQLNGKVSPASDQYAIALMLFVCLTKKHPYAGLQGLPLVRAIEKGQFQKPRELRADIPEELEQIILTAMHLEPEKRYPDVQTLGQKLWLFGSELGQGVWRKYYFQTPALARARNITKPTTTEIPLALQMAEGKVPLSPATVVAHYQSTTAVRAPSKTVDNPDVVGAAEAAATDVDAGGGPSASIRTVEDHEARRSAGFGPSAPTAWQWQSSVSGVSDAEGVLPAVPERKRMVWGAGLAAAVAVLVVGGLMAMRAGRAPVVAVKPLSPLSQPSVSVPAPESKPVAVPAAVPPPPAPAPQPVEAAKVAAAPAAPAVDSSERSHRSKRSDKSKARGKPKSGEWETDADGNFIPPIVP
jgi:serine/threonine-protein kinase